ncbi:hypothetical protein JTB14_011465 [Gonioctena quinquepunctata]|nr:hypothetical protein JTB14_011465 [Gonioctena quinquepunctata]
MKSEEKRIFISDLPGPLTEGEIENAFKGYGNVVSVEIKNRKELGPKNSSLFFAYVNIQTDDRRLQQCFKDFSNGMWLGSFISLQIARESFLERLRKERENDKNKGKIITADSVEKSLKPIVQSNGIVKREEKYKVSSDSSSSESSEADEPSAKRTIVNDTKTKDSNFNLSVDSEKDYAPDFIIKNNRGKVFDKTGLKIASVGKEPIIKVDLTKKSKASSSEANLKRLQSLKNLKKGYHTQKSLIQTALSNIDSKSNNKIVYDDGIKNHKQLGRNQDSLKKSLFIENDSEEEDFEADFNVKEQFQGEKGQKLLELQSKYKNDKRFALDSRFLENNTEIEKSHREKEENEDVTFEEEKNKEYEILEQVLGKKITKLQKQSEGPQKKMLRFDPSQPEHSKYEMPLVEKKKKSKEKNRDNDLLSEKKREEKEVPEVSKEVFYKVTDNLKESLQEKQEFSLLGMFGKTQENEEGDQPETVTKIIPNNLVKEKNPFRYDSSDDDDETENIPFQHEVQQESNASRSLQQSDSKRNSVWNDPFFFRVDDYRLQEGFDFIEKMKLEEKTEFTKLRRNLKEIVKAKVKNNQRKNKMFKKKLGGSRKKKVIRMKKAMKR